MVMCKIKYLVLNFRRKSLFFNKFFMHKTLKYNVMKLVLTKTRNDLKRPTTSKKRPETTYNEQETT